MTGLPRRHRGLLLATITVGAVAVTALSGCTHGNKDFVDPGVPRGSFGLVAFDSCAQALDGLRAAAKAVVGPYGFFSGSLAVPSAGGARENTAAQPAPPAAAGQAGAGQAGDAARAGDTSAKTATEPSYSGTNNHESGVDEPDLVKTDGNRIVTVSAGRLRIVDAASRRLTGIVNLSDPSQPNDPIRYTAADLLLSGDHALVLVNQQYYASGPVIDIAPAPGGVARAGGAGGGVAADPAVPDTINGPSLLLVDLNAARVLSRARVDGALVDARQVGPTARVVVRSAPRLTFPTPADGTAAQRTAANKAAIDNAGVQAWTPRIEVTTGGSTVRSQVGCNAIDRPSSYSGTNLLTVLTFDLGAAALTNGQPVSIVADGDTVYSNGPSLYVASDQSWRAVLVPGSGTPQPVQPSTQIYKFDTSRPGTPAFVAGGSVPGHLINQYALSEWEGKLRVATTTDAVAGQAGQPQAASQSGVYVLAQDRAVLTSVGAVDGLGKGERIYSVRFVGPVGYVVTFRQTDPLYTVDLSDPTRPTIKGELKISGYSAYLHPAEGNRLIGVGQAATAQGRVTGTQVSLFDVGDPANPARLAQYQLSGTNSEAEFDPHAFLYWPADGLVVLPLQGRGVVVSNGTARPAISSGALVLRISGGNISEVGYLTHPASATNGGYPPPIRRSLIIGSTLWTVSDAGLLASDSHSLARLTWIPYS